MLPALAGAALAPFLALAPAAAQDSISRPVVQAVPSPDSERLSEALRQLAHNPQSTDALIAAGQASLGLDDLNAALGFFGRAQALSPGDARAKAGMAAISVRQNQPLSALSLFSEAEAAGADLAPYASDRGLAYDLVGDNAKAQEQYRLVLARGENPAIARRLAISQAIAGNQAASEATLLPMLQRQDLSAYRARAFALAILGQPDEAVSIAETLLPAQLSGRMAPYLRYMAKLTRAQQAAAANLGLFPQAEAIGRDEPQIAALSAQAAAVPGAGTTARSADARLVPSGEPLGRRAEDRKGRAEAGKPARSRREVAATEPAPAPARSRAGAAEAPVQVAAQSQVGELPPLGGQAAAAPAPSPPPVPTPTPAPQPAAVAVAQAPRPLQGPAADPQPSRSGQSFADASLPPTPTPGPAPTPTVLLPPSEQPKPPVEISLRDAFAEFSLAGDAAAVAARPAAGAVDITAIKPPRERPKPPPPPAPPPPPPPPPEPSRHWVQIATGRDVKALGFDWKRLRREAGGLLDKAEPHVAAWGRTNRMVVGPYPSTKAANEMVGKLKDKGFDSFRFDSAEGEKVAPLD
ncbi:conserved hypothetical protein [Altererythrobacter sp. B11]|uniref:tetratricopeptide repeat protein n=1 Tax=Altererythrobacter sp. B11 TaxID=2060312 RepID=UPI000DC71C85|nr:SPOR domain-containing protein [Altererythrobacter sp. B11]BBC74112.1 conserved hypothetical protein [Altererythrobacter sp. B11]